MDKLPDSTPSTARDVYNEHKSLVIQARIARGNNDYYSTPNGIKKALAIRKANKNIERQVKAAKELGGAFYEEADEQNAEIDNAIASGPERIAEILDQLKDATNLYSYTRSALELLSNEQNLPPYIRIVDDKIIIDGFCLDSVNVSPVGMHGYEEWQLRKQRVVLGAEDDIITIECYNSTKQVESMSSTANMIYKKLLKGHRSSSTFCLLSTLNANDEIAYETSPIFTNTISPDDERTASMYGIDSILSGKMPGIYAQYKTRGTNIFN